MSSGHVGRYQLEGEIGRGGMATVQRARDPNSDREVAVKLLPREMMHNPEFRARFKREVNTISTLEHPAIVPVYDSGEEDGQPYFVMRYMAGGSLTERLKPGKLSLHETALIVEKLALGLDYAHQKGVIHRDLKPDNVLFDAEGNPYLSDFGVAKLAEAASSNTGSNIVGTPAYVSPEQAVGENNKVDRRSDVYGLGVLVYQMLTGEQPFTADTAMKVLVKHINEPVPNILKANPELPPALETIIKTAMAKKKEDRYQSVLEFARALSVAAFGPERTMPSALVMERERISASARRGTALIVGSVVLLLIMAGAYFFLPGLKPAPVPTATVTASIPPSATLFVAPVVAPTLTLPIPTETFTPTLEPTSIPTPNGGAEQIALLSGNNIVSMNTDGSNAVVIDSINIDKSDLEWISGERLVYISTAHNCAYMVDVQNKMSQKIICFPLSQQLEGFRVSPDGAHVAISVARTLYIVPFNIEQLRKVNSRFLLTNIGCTYTTLSVKDVRWSNDGKRIAALIVDTRQAGSDQIHLYDLNLQDCVLGSLVSIDGFPAGRFDVDGTVIPSYDWDGNHLFLLNDFVRPGGFGNLYLYDSESHVGGMINPINGTCCYRDARWSPDEKYILFLYQEKTAGKVVLYYAPKNDLDSGTALTPIALGLELLQPGIPPQPALRPAP